MLRPVIAITSGEPAGIGPDIVAQIDPSAFDARLVVLGDRELLLNRAEALGIDLRLADYSADAPAAGRMEIIHRPLVATSFPGKLDAANAAYVLELLELACRGCREGNFDAMVTAPVQKDIINRSGIRFSGHTEFLAAHCGGARPVMLLIAEGLRVALATTHLPLREVADAIDEALIIEIVEILNRDLRDRFGLATPRIKICGLNPHAGENGYLGREEIDAIMPAIERLRGNGIGAEGPFPADTLFTPAMLADTDAVLAMYHDQGLPVLKHVGFHNAVNTTLGLPIVRTSVDHGTALDLAGTGHARADSLLAAIESAIVQAGNLKANAPGA